MVVPRVGGVIETAADVQRTWGEVIRLTRLARRITQTELAKTISSDQSFVSKVERGEATLDATYRVAAGLGLTVADLTRGVTEQLRAG